MPTVQDRLTSILTNYQVLQEAISKAQEDYKRHYDKNRRGNPVLKVGERVWLYTANLKLPCPLQKLGPRFIGLFKIKRVINPEVFELTLPRSYKIHPVFHVSLLKPAPADHFPGREDPRPTPVTVSEETEFEAEAILDSRKRGRQTQYLVK